MICIPVYTQTKNMFELQHSVRLRFYSW